MNYVPELHWKKWWPSKTSCTCKEEEKLSNIKSWQIVPVKRLVRFTNIESRRAPERKGVFFLQRIGGLIENVEKSISPMITAGSKQCSILIGIRFWQWKKSGIYSTRYRTTRFLERLSIAVKHLSTGGHLEMKFYICQQLLRVFCSGKATNIVKMLSTVCISDILLLFEGSAMRSGGQVVRKSNYIQLETNHFWDIYEHNAPNRLPPFVTAKLHFLAIYSFGGLMVFEVAAVVVNCPLVLIFPIFFRH